MTRVISRCDSGHTKKAAVATAAREQKRRVDSCRVVLRHVAIAPNYPLAESRLAIIVLRARKVAGKPRVERAALTLAFGDTDFLPDQCADSCAAGLKARRRRHLVLTSFSAERQRIAERNVLSRRRSGTEAPEMAAMARSADYQPSKANVLRMPAGLAIPAQTQSRSVARIRL